MPQNIPSSRVEQILADKWEEWGLEPVHPGESRAVILLQQEEQFLDLSNPMGPAQAEAELQQVFLQPAARSNRVLAWAFEEGENVERVASECHNPWEAAQFILQTLMLAVGANQDPPPLDRE